MTELRCEQEHATRLIAGLTVSGSLARAPAQSTPPNAAGGVPTGHGPHTGLLKHLIRTILKAHNRPGSPPNRPVATPTMTTRRTWRFETVETLEREVYLLLQHVSGELIHELYTLLKPAGVTPEQYHVLRILRDAGPDGTPLSAVAERSPVGDPDVTGLLDRLEARGLARRTRDAADRRVVIARLTANGRRLLDSLDDPVAALHARQLGPLGRRGLKDLRTLLQQAAAVGPV